VTPPPGKKLDPEATRAAIIEAAEKLFVANGQNGVSMSSIAKEAGVTKSLIHHHFGSKQELWDAVKERGMGAYFEWQREVLLTRGGDDLSLLSDSVAWYFQFLKENPNVVRLMTWMAVEPENCVERDPGLMQLGAERLREGQALGLIRKDIDPASVIVGFLCLCEHWFQLRHVLLAGFVDGDTSSDEPDRRFLDTILKIIEQGIAALPTKTA
jgi:TetR/AcrR family transcriptional regulator